MKIGRAIVKGCYFFGFQSEAKLEEDSEALKGIQIEWLHNNMISINLKSRLCGFWCTDLKTIQYLVLVGYSDSNWMFLALLRGTSQIWLLRVTSKEKVMKMMETEPSSLGLYILEDSTTFMIELKHHWRDSGSGYYSELEDEDSYKISRTLQLQIQRNLYSLSSPALYELLSNTWWSSQIWYDFWLAYYFNICLLESYLVSKLLPLMIQGTDNTTICAVIPWLYYMWSNVTCAR